MAALRRENESGLKPTPLLRSVLSADTQAEGLWDTGAWVSLVDQATAQLIVNHGGKLIMLSEPRTLTGAGGATVTANQAVQTTLQLHDGLPRDITFLVVDKLPFKMIIGQPFMLQHGLAALLSADHGFHIYDHMKLDSAGRPRLIHKELEVGFGSQTSAGVCPVIMGSDIKRQRKLRAKARKGLVRQETCSGTEPEEGHLQGRI